MLIHVGECRVRKEILLPVFQKNVRLIARLLFIAAG
jgi:hypothetical protein